MPTTAEPSYPPEQAYLGEIQQGFRRDRMGADNAFIMNSILWKSASRRKKVHMAFFDISKAYDTVDRGILWRRMSALGFGGQLLGATQLYLLQIYRPRNDPLQAIFVGRFVRANGKMA